MFAPIRLPAAFTRLARLLALRDRRPASGRPAAPRPGLEALEERLTPDGRPLPFPVVFAGADAGRPAQVRAYDADTGALRWTAAPFGPGFEGGARVAAGDITGDGIPDAVVAAGPGAAPRVRVLDGVTGAPVAGPLGDFLAFGAGATGGVWVASGDVNGDGRQDVIAAALTTSGPRVKAFRATDGAVLADFAVTGPGFAGGLTVAAADFTGDGKVEVAVGGSAGGRVRVYDPLAGNPIGGPLGGFRAFGPGYDGAVFVGADERAGDVDGDGVPDLAVGTGEGAPARVRVFSGATGAVLRDFRPFGAGFEGGARVALAYVDDDARADVVVGSGPGRAARVRVFSGATGAQLGDPLGQYAPFGGFEGGAFVGASNDPTVVNVLVNADAFENATAPSYFLLQRKGDLTDALTVNLSFAGTATRGTDYTVASVAYFQPGNLWSDPVTVHHSDDSLFEGDETVVLTIEPGAGYVVGGMYAGTGLIRDDESARLTRLLAAGLPCGPDLVNTAAGVGAGLNLIGALLGGGPGAERAPFSGAGVRYGAGTLTVGRTDLASAALGDGWGTDWTYTSGGAGDGASGAGATAAQFAHLVQVSGDDTVAVVSSATTARYFDRYGGAYHALFGDATTLVHDTANGRFVATDGTGRTLTFYDFSAGTPAGRAGKLVSVADADGQLTAVTSWTTAGRPAEVRRTTGSGASARTESFVYAYVASGANAGLLESVLQRTQVGTGAWAAVRSVAYTYHDGTTAAGPAGALRTAAVKDAAGATIDTSYYRYFTSGTGSAGKLAFAFGPAAYARLTAALGTGVDALTDAQVAPYADTAAGYGWDGRVTTVVSAGSGCSVCAGGLGTYTYAYASNAPGPQLPNRWADKTVETRPDGSTLTVYTNAFGQVMLTALSDGTGTWLHYTRYDGAGRVVLAAGPSAVTGFSEANDDLVGFAAGNAAFLSDTTGLFAAVTYGDATTATASAAGDAAGYLKAVDIRQGETGAAVPQYAVSYLKNTAGGVDFFHPAAETAFRNDDGTGARATSYAYTFLAGTNQVASATVTLPAVTTAQNGPGSATAVTVVNDAFGRPIWTRDAGGFLTYTAYDDLTGGVVKTIADVDATQTATFADLPAGWATPSGGGLHLTTTFEVDSLGRPTKTTYPNGRVDYAVYDDAAREVRTYAGWDAAADRPTGPTVVTREDRANGYTETLTMSAAPAVSGGRPTGAESISQVQSLSRSYVNAAGQVTHTDAYFELTGLAYSTAPTLGLENLNFYRTRYQYDDTGAVKRVQTPQGTVTRTVRDGIGRPLSEWVGTDDTPTGGFWSPTNLAGTNTVKVREYQYDGGGVGDGNLTQVTEFPGAGAAARVTQTWFDWRNRAVAVKSGVESSEAGDVNRPLVYTVYDNLGQVTKSRVYDADGVAPAVVNGVPQALAAGLLRAQSTTSYDELGRAFRTDTFSVDPVSGAVGSSTLYAQTWYDARGNVAKTLAPGGLVQKAAFDGAGRLTVAYTTDGGGDAGYGDALTVAGDTVLEQAEYAYDPSGNVLTITTRQRFHDASGTGALGSPTAGVPARVSYMGYYYDLADRPTASVDVGTNGGTAWTRPGTVPSGSATVLVTRTRYATDAVQVLTPGAPAGGTFTLTFGGQTTGALAWNASAAAVQAALEGLSSIGTGNVLVSAAAGGGGGWEVRFTGALGGAYQPALVATGGAAGVTVTALSLGGDAGRAAEVTDPAGRVSRAYTDPLGRPLRSVRNFVDGVVSDGDDASVGYAYNGAGVRSVTAFVTGGGGQTTEYVYGVSQGTGSAIDSNDAVGATRWPDPTTGVASASEQELATVNALGQTLTATDRNGTVHALTYDVLGRVTSDAVTALGAGVDGAVRRVETAYDGQGNAYLVTSYDAASGGAVVNQVRRAFNGLGQLVTEWQAHSGAVDIATTPKVGYAYTEMAGGADHSRPTSVTYPSGYVLTDNYSAGLNGDISRLSSLSDSTGTLEGYSYLGLGTVVVRSHPQPNVDLSYVKRAAEAVGDAGDQYAGLDRFGRVADQRWLNPTTGTATDRLQYGYDTAGSRTFRDNLVSAAFGELYTYDGLDQLATFARGTLDGTRTGVSGTPSRTQAWDLDATGNWEGLKTDGAVQARTHNRQNEVTGVGGATAPTFDAAGNMTGDEAGRRFVYDAWNRLVAVKDSSGTTLKTYHYDGLSRRVSETLAATGATTALYYSAGWQVLEEKVGAGTSARYVWSPVYVDALVLRDRDTDADGTPDERLWVQQDANWNVTALVDGSGAVVERYAYDPFGVRTVYDAGYNVRSGGSAYGFAHGFQGMAFDAVAALSPQRFRWYSPTLGRWVSTDPIGFAAGDVNLYRYEGNNAVRYLDPSGLDVVDWWRRNGINTRIGGGFRMLGGGLLFVAGTSLGVASSPTGVGAVGGALVAGYGVDMGYHGFLELLDGKSHPTWTSQTIDFFAGRPGIGELVTTYLDTTVAGYSLYKSAPHLYAMLAARFKRPPAPPAPAAPAAPAAPSPAVVKVVSRANPPLRDQSVPAIYDSSTGKLYIGSSAESHEAAVRLSRLSPDDPTLRGLSIIADGSGNLRVLNGGSLTVPRYISNPSEIAAVRAAIEQQFGCRIIKWSDLPPPPWLGLK